MKESQNQNKEPQKVLGRLIGTIAKSMLLGLLKGLILIIYFTAKVTEIIAGNIVESLKKHI
jgi:hypothetical protein